MSEVIFSYTRKEAIEDGVLIDVTATAKEAGFKIPVAITAGVFESLSPTEADKALGQDFEGRLWDVLHMLRLKARTQGGSLAEFRVYMQRARYGGKTHLEDFVAVVGPGDEAEPVMTIMLPGED
jgi:hypothetical protein